MVRAIYTRWLERVSRLGGCKNGKTRMGFNQNNCSFNHSIHVAGLLWTSISGERKKSTGCSDLLLHP